MLMRLLGFFGLQESASVKVTAALSMWELCMEKGSAELEQFQKIHGFISDQLFSDFVSESFIPFFHMKA